MKHLDRYLLFDKWIIIIFCISMLVQVGLASVNRESNDDHMEVTERILNHLPVEREDCSQCYHPKFYHYTVAGISYTLNATTYKNITLVGQIVDVVAGGLILVILWLFLYEYPTTLLVKRLVFTFFALNPELISSTVQATNNAFVVLFSTAALYGLWKFFKTHKKAYFAVVIVSVILAALTKGSGLVLCAGVVLALIIHLFSSRKNPAIIRHHSAFAILFSVVFVISMVFISPYYSYYLKYSSPLVGNWETNPSPHLIEKTYYGRPGITSLVDGFLTFRFVDLMKSPFLTNETNTYSLHRTSFWSNLYGRMYSIHFSEWPQSWQSLSGNVMFVTRGLFILGLIPTFLICLGLVVSLQKMWVGIRLQKSQYFTANPNWIFVIFLGLMVAMVGKLSLVTRDFSAIKMIYIYPALLSLVYFFIEGYGFVQHKIHPHTTLFTRLSVLWMGVLVAFILCDLGLLYVHLAGL